MCGINGIFAYHSAANPPIETELLLTREHMRARGPDGAGLWWSTHRRCGIAHRRLSIVDLSDRAAQPMVSDDGSLVVTFNGEIYNYPALRTELEHQGFPFRTTSDTEVLLHLFARDGADMVGRLCGMFAFAIWNNVRRELFLARDPYGIKPLYTSNDGWTFRFASQVKALLAGGQISREPEPAGIVGFHLFGSVPEPFTLYRDIRALPAGHTQRIDFTGPHEPKPFANIAQILADGAQKPAPARSVNERVRSATRRCVHDHLLADVEVGIFLSAGIDLAAILGLMRDAGQRDVPALTVAFDEFRGMPEDEAPIASEIAELYGARHIVRRVSEEEFCSDLPAILHAMDQPTIDGINTWFVAKAAKEAGIKVAISGLGGDELFAGYPSFIDVPRWHRRYGPIAAIPGVGRLSRLLLRSLRPNLATNWPKALGVLEYANSWAGAYLLRRGLFLPHELDVIFNADIVREGFRRLNPLKMLAANMAPDPGSDLARVCALESSHYLRNQLLRDADWAGMAHGVEIRTPLVDVTLLQELAPLISGRQFGAGKMALAMAPLLPLPNSVMERPKTGFGVPIGVWTDRTRRNAMPRSNRVRSQSSRSWSRVVLADFVRDSDLALAA